MDRKGNIDMEECMKILFHWSSIFERKGFFPFYRLVWIYELPELFTMSYEHSEKVVLCEPWNRKTIEKLIEQIPFIKTMVYSTIGELRVIANSPILNIHLYIDDDAERGSMFGKYWIDHTNKTPNPFRSS